MGVVTGLVLFAVIWFMVLFILLPVGLRTQGDEGDVVDGTHASAPANFSLKRKARMVTIVSTVIWVIVAAVILSGLITIEDLDWFNRVREGLPVGETGG